MNDDRCVVYWIFDETCFDVMTTGYVGVTKNIKTRFAAHLRNRRVPFNSQIRILFEGTRRECFKFEEIMRPVKSIGWNNAAGGSHGWRVGFSHSQDVRDKLRAAWTEERREKASKFKAQHNKLLIGQKRPKQSKAMSGALNPMFGTKRPRHVIEAMRKARLGKPGSNRQEIYCIGCHEHVNHTTLKKYHNKCFKKFCVERMRELYPTSPYGQEKEV